MADFLRGMAVASRRRAAFAARGVPLAEMRRRAAAAAAPPELRLSPEGFDVIAEVKRRAPGAGQPVATDPALPGQLARAYATAGAAAVSVLTEPLAFGGSVADLEAASTAAATAAGRPVPTMRKDFVVEPYQVYEARAAGAGGILLIAGLVTEDVAPRLLDAVADTGLWVLVEAFDDDLVPAARALARRAAGLGVRALLGVNVRDLRTLDLDPDRLARVAPRLPGPESGIPRVAESGIRTPADAARAADLGYEVALVGRALASAADPAARLAELLAAGRSAARGVALR